MTRKRKPKTSGKVIEQYEHRRAERVNNPPVGLVSPELNGAVAKKRYQYDPHLDPQLAWAGKAEGTSFEADTVSLHVHERIEPKTIIEAVRNKKGPQQAVLASFFSSPGENPPYREAIDFYRHKHGWSNRLIAGDSLLVMNSLLEKEGMRGQIQMIYIDPPYGIKYGSNFQPFVNKRDVKDRRDEDLTQEPEMIKAFRDTWELGIHSYLSYIRDRLLLAKDLLTESGSIFFQISDENVHYAKAIMEEIFGADNFVSLISFRKTSAQTAVNLPSVSDYLLWFAKNKPQLKYNQLYFEKAIDDRTNYFWAEDTRTHERKRLAMQDAVDIDRKKHKLFRLSEITSQTGTESSRYEYEFEGKKFRPVGGRGWSTSRNGLDNLKKANRLMAPASILCYVRYYDDFPVRPLTNLWQDTGSGGFLGPKIFIVQTSEKTIQRCILMTTDPGDLVFDPTCGSGTTAYVAEQWGRRWITCDTSRVAIALAKQRLMTAVFDYYQLAHPNDGVQGDFRYETIPHVTLKSIVYNEPPEKVELHDQPMIDDTKARVSGPFTLEAVPAPSVKPVDEIQLESEADQAITRTGETLRQSEWRSELIKTGIRGKGGQQIEFSRVETLSGTMWLHADAETKEAEPKRVVVSFGPDHAPLEQKQVTLALEESSHLFPRPKIVVFAAFQFDPEAAKDIDEANLPGVILLKVQMNADLLTEDLKKKRSSNESFWLIGQPDIEIKHLEDGKIQVEVRGFDYYNTRTGEIESGGPGKIAMWMLDTDYDYRSLYPHQVFFPMAADDEGWSRLARNLKAEIDEELIEHYRGTLSLPFKPGGAIAAKIIDDRGIESLKIIRM